MATPRSLPYTGDAPADRLLADSPIALVIGMVLYQQVPVEKAFLGPAALQERLGIPLDAKSIAEMDPAALEEIFRARPALHRFPANMAKRVQAVCAFVADVYGGDPSRLWLGVGSAAEVVRRMTELPGFGDYKARVYFGVLVKRLGVAPPGWQEMVPDWPSIADVEKAEDLDDLKARKKAWKEGG
jgi:uncharacterized HhH-GPD family protein